MIISLSFIHLTLAYGKDFFLERHKISTLHNIEAGSALIILIIGILGIAFIGSFLANFISRGTLFTLKSSGIIPLLNIAIGAKAGMALYLVFYYLVVHRSVLNKSKSETDPFGTTRSKIR